MGGLSPGLPSLFTPKSEVMTERIPAAWLAGTSGCVTGISCRSGPIIVIGLPPVNTLTLCSCHGYNHASQEGHLVQKPKQNGGKNEGEKNNMGGVNGPHAEKKRNFHFLQQLLYFTSFQGDSLLPQRKKVLGSTPGPPFCVDFACCLHVHVGSLHFLPLSKDLHLGLGQSVQVAHRCKC